MIDHVKIIADDDGQRLDRWIKKYYPAVSFGQVQKAVRTGQVRIDGKRAKADTRLAAGQEVRIPPQFISPIEKEEKLSDRDVQFIKSLIIYEDQHLFAINKPSGLASQGGSKINKHVDGLIAALADKDGVKPRLIHRLDKDTSGVLLLARSAKAAKEMGHLFKGRDVRKYYWALTIRVPEMHQGKIQTNIGKMPVKGGERIMGDVDEEDGKFAQTYYSVIEAMGKRMAWIAFWPRTGRTHQLRVHALEIKCPILGDFKYDPHQEFFDENPNLEKTLHLHARRVMFKHPFTGKQVDIIAPLTNGMAKTFEFLSLDADNNDDPFEILE